MTGILLSGGRRAALIDITWNPVSRLFFVGYNLIGGGFEACEIRQAALTSTGSVTFVRTMNPQCDGGGGGHRSASSTDDNLDRNPTGQYLWYFQESSGSNKVHSMDNAGNVVASLDLGEGPILALPLPVSLANVHEVAGPSYAVSIIRVGTAFLHPFTFLTLAADGSIMSN